MYRCRLLAIGATWALLACGNGRSTGHGPTGPSTGTVRGRAAIAVQGATALVFQVQPGGGTAVESAAVTLDATGSYAVAVSFPGKSVDNLIVQIQSGTETIAEAMVATPLTNGATVTAPPASLQTWTLTRVFVDAEQSGLWDSSATTAGLSALIDATTADSIAASPTSSTDVHAVAAAAVDAMDARAAMLMSATLGGSAAALDAYLAAEIAAQAQEDSALDAATDVTATSAAIQARGVASVSAAATAAIPLSLYDQAARAENVAYADSSSLASPPVQAAMMVSGAQIEATAVTAADASALQALGAGAGPAGDLAAAALQLSPAIAISSGSAAAIAAAWSAYEASALTDVKAAATAIHVDGGSNIDAASNAVSPQRTQAVAALAAAGSASAIVQALATFQSAVATAVSNQTVLSIFSSAQFTAVVSVLTSVLIREGQGPAPAVGGTITGQVAGAVAGTSVTAYQASGTGALTAVANAVTVDASGAYSLQVTAPSVSDAIVIASAGANTVGKVIVTGVLPGGGSLSAAPIDSQTTVETDIYLSALTNGYWSSADTTAAIRGDVSTGLASALAASGTYDADVQASAKALTGAIGARQALLALPSVGLSANAIVQFQLAETAAQQAEDAALNAATSPPEISTAIQTREDAVLVAAAMADMSPAQFSLATLAATDAGQASSGGLSTAVAAAFVMTLEGMEAHFLATANEVELNAFTIGSSLMTSLATADTSLETSLAASAGDASTIAAAWAQYDQTVEGALQSTAESAQPGSSAAIASVESDCSVALMTYETQATAAGMAPQSTAQTAATFSASVQGEVAGDTTLAALGTAETSAVAAVLVNLLAAR